MKYYSLGDPLGGLYQSGESAWSVTLPWWHSDKYLFYQDKPILEWNPNNFAFASDNPPLDFLQVSEYVHLVSPKLQVILSSYCQAEDFQFLPLRLRSSRGDNIIGGYSLCHYRRWCKAVDPKRSRLVEHETRFIKHPPHGMYYLDHVALSRSKIGDAKVFRVIGCPGLFAYQEDVVDSINSSGLTGLNFVELDVQ